MGLCTGVRRWTRFNAVGAAGVCVQLGVLAVLVHGLRLNALVATGIAVEAAVLHNFFWHQRWTWRDRPALSIQVTVSRFVQFQLLNGLISLAGNLALVAVITWAFHLDPMLGNLIAISVCSLANFAASDALVFADRRTPAYTRPVGTGRTARSPTSTRMSTPTSRRRPNTWRPSSANCTSRRRSRSRLLDDSDFEQLRPELACHEQAISGLVVRDAVQDVNALGGVAWIEQSLQIDPARHPSGLR